VLIDWFTVGAQALNFVVLVWLLKRFLYKPILSAIDTREQRIAAELADAAAKQADAKQERDEFQRKNEEFDQQGAARMRTAEEEVKAERQRLLGEARHAADALSAKRQEALAAEARRLNKAITRQTQREVFAIARQVLADLATTSLEERMGEVFARRLGEMDVDAKNDLGRALKTASEPGIVRSAFEMPAAQRATMQNTLNETFSADVRLRFETAPELVSGIELSANGLKMGWNIADYLASLEQGVVELLSTPAAPEPSHDTTPEPAADAQGGERRA